MDTSILKSLNEYGLHPDERFYSREVPVNKRDCFEMTNFTKLRENEFEKWCDKVLKDSCRIKVVIHRDLEEHVLPILHKNNFRVLKQCSIISLTLVLRDILNLDKRQLLILRAKNQCLGMFFTMEDVYDSYGSKEDETLYLTYSSRY